MLRGMSTYAFCASYSESYNEDASEVRAEVQTAWNEVKDFPLFVLGDVVAGGTLLNRKLPLLHPTKLLWASELSIKQPVGAYRTNGDTGLVEFFDNVPDAAPVADGVCKWEIVFRPRPYSVTANDKITSELQRWVIKEADFNIEALSLPGGFFKFVSNGAKIPEGMALQHQLCLHRYTWVMVPDTVVQTLRRGVLLSVPGRVNSAEFDGMPIGSALCLAPKISPLKYTVTDTACRDISYSFLQRFDNTWNQVYNPNRLVAGVVNPGFDDVVSTLVGGSPPYLSADFATLFVPV